MENLLFIKDVKGKEGVYPIIKQRLREFSSFENKGNKEWFSEMCFCLLTANASAKGGIAVQEALGSKGFLSLPEKKLAKRLKEIGYRFPNVRAKYIVEARKHTNIKNVINGMTSHQAREWLVKNIKGLGMKEASHFLRNVGRKDVGILDKHILRSMKVEAKPLSPKKYVDVEKKLFSLAKSAKTNMAELDLILWYGQTGEVLK
ncbi:N-glycosylase/DNA lyase [Nanoarchaeota archaeon]